MKDLFKINTKQIAGIAILTALEIIFQLVGNYVTIGPVNVNLALIPIVIGAILYGPLCGLFLGFINGIIVMTAPSTQTFFAASWWGTIITCLVKTMTAGFLAGLIYYPLSKKNKVVAVIITSLSVPIINTLIFVGFCFAFFFQVWGSASQVFFGTILSFNFLVEILTTVILTPGIIKIIKIYEKRKEERGE